MDISKAIDWIKLPAEFLLPIVLSSLILLIAPYWLLDTVGMIGIVESLRPYIGLIFLLSSVLLLSRGAVWTCRSLYEKIESYWLLRDLRKMLHNLSSQEKDVLRKYIQNDTKTLYFSLNNGVVAGLRSLNILYRSSTVGYPQSWAHNIQPWAWDYLKDHPELLD